MNTKQKILTIVIALIVALFAGLIFSNTDLFKGSVKTKINPGTDMGTGMGNPPNYPELEYYKQLHLNTVFLPNENPDKIFDQYVMLENLGIDVNEVLYRNHEKSLGEYDRKTFQNNQNWETRFNNLIKLYIKIKADNPTYTYDKIYDKLEILVNQAFSNQNSIDYLKQFYGLYYNTDIREDLITYLDSVLLTNPEHKISEETISKISKYADSFILPGLSSSKYSDSEYTEELCKKLQNARIGQEGFEGVSYSLYRYNVGYVSIDKCNTLYPSLNIRHEAKI